jgi:isocitrate dehydrogenase (NAD+)
LTLDRKNVVACHKAGIMKMGDGLFINTAAEVAKNYPSI